MDPLGETMTDGYITPRCCEDLLEKQRWRADLAQGSPRAVARGHPEESAATTYCGRGVWPKRRPARAPVRKPFWPQKDRDAAGREYRRKSKAEAVARDPPQGQQASKKSKSREGTLGQPRTGGVRTARP